MKASRDTQDTFRKKYFSKDIELKYYGSSWMVRVYTIKELKVISRILKEQRVVFCKMVSHSSRIIDPRLEKTIIAKDSLKI